MSRGRKLWWLGLILALSAASGCGREGAPSQASEESSSGGAGAPADSLAQTDSSAGDATLLGPAPIRFSAAARAFPHVKHVQVKCAVCHAPVPGHATHANIECSDCHPTPAGRGAGAVLTPDECQSCHHDQTPARACTRCHDPPPTERLDFRGTLRLSVWSEARDVTLPFPHSEHDDASCSECHSGTAMQVTPSACGSCHDKHHVPEADCTECHREAPPTAHDIEVHRGCGGGACHTRSVSRQVFLGRTTCLFCHTDRADHEPGASCASCHKVAPARAGEKERLP